MIHDAVVITDVGHVRDHNEDDSLILDDQQVYVVADGMGGHACGEVASRISVESVEEFYRSEQRTSELREEYRDLRREGLIDRGVSFEQFRLQTAIQFGNWQIFEEASRDSRYEDMGTTIVGIAFSGARVYVGHVGDSRAYRFRDGTLEQLTEDHSLANEFIRMNMLRPEDLPRFPYKNVIVRALGLQAEVPVDTFYKTCRPGDRYLLCTDGLSDLVTDDEIGAVLNHHASADAAARTLVDRALAHGGLDNVTVLLVDVRE